MATKKNPVPQAEEGLPELEPQEGQTKADDTVKQQQAEIEKLRKQIEALQAGTRATSRNDADLVKEACQQAAESGVDPWEVKVKVRAPRRPGREDPFYWLNVNGRILMVPADEKYYDLALPWAECLINSLDAENKAADFQDSLEVHDPITNPHKE